jgi:rfaE bifunctional protein nucleotidyltransferase chain/domain
MTNSLLAVVGDSASVPDLVSLAVESGVEIAPVALNGIGDTFLRHADAVLVLDSGPRKMEQSLRDTLTMMAARLPVVWSVAWPQSPPIPGTGLAVLTDTDVSAYARHALSRVDRWPVGSPISVIRTAAAVLALWKVNAVVVTTQESEVVLCRPRVTPLLLSRRLGALHATFGSDPAKERFAAVAALAAARGQSVRTAAEQAADWPPGENMESGRSVQPKGVLDCVRAAGGTVVGTGGCFDLLHAGHLATLSGARRLGDCLIVLVNSDASVHRLKGTGRPVVPVADRVRLLRSLECVDAVVVFDEDEPADAIERLRPDVWVKGGDYADFLLPEQALLERWGGQAVVLPQLPGRSTTTLVRILAGTTP